MRIYSPVKKSVYDYFQTVEAKTAKEMAEQTGLDMVAVKIDIPCVHPITGDPIECNDEKMIINLETGTKLSIMSTDYGLFQYMEMMDFTEVMVKEDEASYVAGGLVGDGKQGYVVMKTADYISFDGSGKDVECYFQVSSSHDGTTRLRVRMTPLVQSNKVVLYTPGCEINIKHTKHIADRVSQAKRSIGKVRAKWEEFQDTFKTLSITRLTPQIQLDYLKMMVPDAKTERGQTKVDNLRAELLKVYSTSAACQLPSVRGTMLGLYFAVCEYYEHYSSVKKRKYLDPTSARLLNQLDGNAAEKKAKAYAGCIQISEKFKGYGSNA